jgi:hypothetical protein
MSFLYPRTISVTRPANAVGTGVLGYSGELKSTETVVRNTNNTIATGLRASIQLEGKTRGTAQGLLAADVGSSNWYIYVPDGTLGQIQTRDVVTDDLGLRYVVIAPYWNALGYQLLTQLLQV